MKELTHGTVLYKDLSDNDLYDYFLYLVSKPLSEKHIELCFEELKKRNMAIQCDDGYVEMTNKSDYISCKKNEDVVGKNHLR